MTYDYYYKLAVITFPDMQFDKCTNWNQVDLIKAVTAKLFLEEVTCGILAGETRKQLKNLRAEGVHCFDKKENII